MPPVAPSHPIPLHRPLSAACALALLVLSASASAQQNQTQARTLDSVEVVAPRRALAEFPGAVTVIEGRTLREGQRQVNLSEALARVPGISVLDRQNYAQDLQVQSRGFGARSTFGIRGIRLVVDGIPSTAADGQGQAANFPLDALDRIEVLRGPLALQYGNAAGGAIVAATDLQRLRGASAQAWGGDHGSYRVGALADGASEDGRWRGRVGVSRFGTDGERPHSAAQRSQFDAVAEWSPREGERLRLVLNSLSQPDTDDPLGLDRAGLRADPHGTDPVALRFDTRKRIGNHQAGLRWQRDYAPGREAWVGAYGIRRDVVQYLAIPMAAQTAPGSAGGVIDLGRRSTGLDAGHRWYGARGGLALGVELARLDEDRRGYENYVGDRLGVRGRLRRDERNRIADRELYAVGDYAPAAGWTLLGAVRHARLEFRSDDRYFAPGNGDDGGRADYRETSAALGLSRAFARGEVFASLGRGFETPTATELAYRADGSAGFNRELQPARFDTAELGLRWRRGGARFSAAVYRVEGEHEIVPADSRGGRASFANAGRTRRDGVELGLDGDWGAQWRYAVAANWIDARFEQSFAYRVQGATRTVAAGSRVPGVPRADGYAELAWRSRDGALGAALEGRFSDRIAVDDRNTDFAAGNARFALRLDWRPRNGRGWRGFARVDNLFDRDYVGSVIVNEGNARYFEPGAGRGFTLGLAWDAVPRAD
ncbi:TonB-dependent receptor family protein [Lysobacter silvisoli]|uniref:TonB-dependent receptor n=1 Tax=Lysobacter silvisoli TaxID=2293254 RepID=A0A371K4I1_9GAMM|nr:TonB-dependent receptor [Lysobacter silvisoli]RDZ28780.1 TonB-dependent receptor [Lysobacter silvisoli]